MIKLMKPKVDLRSLEDDRCVLLANQMHLNPFYGQNKVFLAMVTLEERSMETHILVVENFLKPKVTCNFHSNSSREVLMDARKIFLNKCYSVDLPT